mmetsp:Transcript_23714/g.82016  ORF Transcript_23714/g.82016 Transcript_23714/m.82016 type:complete len:477 (+) Transcript_23714:2602-4032(+)
MEVRRAPNLRALSLAPSSQGTGGLPAAATLVEVESKFGEPITVTDIDGRPPPRHRRTEGRSSDAVSAGTAQTVDLAEAPEASNARISDCRNAAYESFLANRLPPPDFLAERAADAFAAEAAAKERRSAAAALHALDTVPATYVYSGQKLQYTELKKAEERLRLKGEGVTFVRAASAESNYLHTTVAMVDEARLLQDAAAASRARWKTKRGFVYPAPRPSSDYNAHAGKPSAARVDELLEPWDDTLDQMRQLAAKHRADFDTIPSNGNTYFGGHAAAAFDRNYDGNYLGNYAKLPRGRERTTKLDEHAYTRSVHLGGLGAAAEQASQKAQDREAWRCKVVVDSLDFKIDGFSQKDRPSQTDRGSDILHGAVHSKALRIVRNARLPSGKVATLRPAPLSIFSTGAFAEGPDYAATLRQYGAKVVDRTAAGEEEFKTQIHRDLLRRASEKVLCRKAITAVDPGETAHDARWRVAPAKAD